MLYPAELWVPILKNRFYVHSGQENGPPGIPLRPEAQKILLPGMSCVLIWIIPGHWFFS